MQFIIIIEIGGREAEEEDEDIPVTSGMEMQSFLLFSNLLS